MLLTSEQRDQMRGNSKRYTQTAFNELHKDDRQMNSNSNYWGKKKKGN